MATRLLLVGLGSIGVRHARLLRSHFAGTVEVVALRSDPGRAGNELAIPEIFSWQEVDHGSFDAALISNPTCMHIETAVRCAQRDLHIFLEKPVDCTVDGLDELIRIVSQRHLTAYVAYPLRYHPVVHELRQRLIGRTVLHVSMVCASFLPQWRPGRDHTTIYSARSDLGGGVFLDMSHELDLADYLFGPVLGIQGRLDRVAEVTVDSDDCADVLLEHAWGTTNVHLNSFSQTPRRTIEIETADGYLRGDIRGQTVTDVIQGQSDETVLVADADQMYVEQLQHFLGNLGSTDLDNSLLRASGLYRKMIAFREEQGYGAANHHLRPRRVAGSQEEEHPAPRGQTAHRPHD